MTKKFDKEYYKIALKKAIRCVEDLRVFCIDKTNKEDFLTIHEMTQELIDLMENVFYYAYQDGQISALEDKDQ